MEVCFNYGCQAHAIAEFTEVQLEAAVAGLSEAASAAEEREHVATIIGRLYRVAGTQTPIAADRAGNFADQGVDGKMDCIDHSTTTMRLLEMLQARGLLRYHRVADRARRTSLVLFQHFSAVLEEIEVAPQPAAPATEEIPDHVPILMTLCDCPPPEHLNVAVPVAATPKVSAGAKFVIDSWFVEQGEPAVVLPLNDWLDGDGPYVP